MRIPKINIPKKYIKPLAWLTGGFILILLLGGTIVYAKRESLLKNAISKAIQKAKIVYGVDLKIAKSGFSGFSTVSMHEVSVVPENRDTLVHIKDVTIGVKLLPLIFGNVKLSEIKLNDGKLFVSFKDNVSNLDFILKKKSKESINESKNANLAELASNLLNQVLYKIPDHLQIKNLLFQLFDNGKELKLLTQSAIIDNGNLLSSILVNDTVANWHLNGIVKPGRKKIDIQLFADHKKVELDYINQKINGKISFDTVRTKLEEAYFKGNDFKISGSWSVKNLLINQIRIAGNDIIIPSAKIEADMFVGPEYIGLDSSSTIYFKNAKIHPYLKYTIRPNKIYELKIRTGAQDAQAVLNSMPQGLFESLEGLQVSGKLNYTLDFHLDSSIPDSVQFNSTLTPLNFKILKWGKTDFQKINGDFIYTPYEYGKPMRNILIGRGNPNFTPFEDISPNFKNALITSEDPSFFRHKGFVEASIRSSIAVNFKEKRFKRGGSTISMQLVKNVFLSRQKTLARKAEEILIVWLIENNKLISKQRMIEVYFNIIEMGYNVYGIGEAARHYFGKSPADLTLGEGIFLANIVPKPKASMFKFNSDGSLKPYLFNYFNFIGGTMARRGLTEPDSSGYGFYNVRLREGLRQFLPNDSTKIDTTSVDDDDIIAPITTTEKPKNLFERIFSSVKKDTVLKAPAKIDSPKTRKQLRQERREERKKGNN